MEALLIGIATAFNLLIIKTKISKHRYEDATLDVTSFIILAALFGGTMGGMIIATIASAIISLSLLVSPPLFTKKLNVTGFWEEFKTKLPQS